MTTKQQAYLLLHFSVILWGFTAILGALISLSAVILVWYRVALTSLFLLFWPGLIRKLLSLPRAIILKFTWIGIIVALHWICFYGSIKLANASIALIGMSTSALFTSFIEPIMFKRRIDKVDIILSLIVIPAMMLTIYDFDSGKMLGFWVGIIAALLAALFSVMNKKMINKSEPEVITFIEMFVAFLFLSIMCPLFFLSNGNAQLIPDMTDLGYLMILSVFCTILPFVLHLKALKHISAFASNLVVNLEPVYGIILAVVILKEHKEFTWSFYFGVLIIMTIVLVYPFLKKHEEY